MCLFSCMQCMIISPHNSFYIRGMAEYKLYHNNILSHHIYSTIIDLCEISLVSTIQTYYIYYNSYITSIVLAFIHTDVHECVDE